MSGMQLHFILNSTAPTAGPTIRHTTTHDMAPSTKPPTRTLRPRRPRLEAHNNTNINNPADASRVPPTAIAAATTTKRSTNASRRPRSKAPPPSTAPKHTSSNSTVDRQERTRHLQNLRQRRYRARKKCSRSARVTQLSDLQQANAAVESEIHSLLHTLQARIGQ
ncbi:TPA: hypothetical protein N0F65_002445 [Lagenidium giganteum]|uniref:BZIP domain-containing protein n=1 Tax=Lagenidium giganteum TaxID=4803 RepID=A0AAV2YJL7_9STRA|nr:TPA: hypothetical protein N0F65_002445 [Lagenidium giganteum]